MEDLKTKIKLKASYISKEPIEISCGCEINSLKITGADTQENIYKGNISIADYFNGDKPHTNLWFASLGDDNLCGQRYDISGKKYGMNIVPVNSKLKGEFTIIPKLDKEIKYHILRAIISINPNIPYKG